MIVFGCEYRFIEKEKELLKKRFGKIAYIDYENHPSEDFINNIKKIIDELKPKQIILNISSSPPDKIVKLLTNINIEKEIKFITIEHFLESNLSKCYIPKTYKDLHYLEDIKPFTKWQYIQKRAIDYFGLFWLFFFSCYLFLIKIPKKIKSESPGDIYFKQKRVGINNKIFECVKFRTMHENSHFDPYTKENDSRIFPYGKVMREKRFDELPQMINILKGDMHLIGPRAEWNILVENYENEIPYYNERHLVKPGITGWAQVMYPYGEGIEDARQKLMYDLYYIKYWNILFELKIVWKTAMTVIKKEVK